MILDCGNIQCVKTLGNGFQIFVCERFTGELLGSAIPFWCTSGMGQMCMLKKKKKRYPGLLLWKIPKKSSFVQYKQNANQTCNFIFFTSHIETVKGSR